MPFYYYGYYEKEIFVIILGMLGCLHNIALIQMSSILCSQDTIKAFPSQAHEMSWFGVKKKFFLLACLVFFVWVTSSNVVHLNEKKAPL